MSHLQKSAALGYQLIMAKSLSKMPNHFCSLIKL